jgi:ClpP class serine protease
MPRGLQGRKRPADVIGTAITVARIATGEIKETKIAPSKNPAAVALGRRGGARGGQARADKLSPDERHRIAATQQVKAGEARAMAMQDKGAKGANEFLELTLAQYLSDLETQFSADCLTYVGPLVSGADDRIRDGIEAIRQKSNKLVVILETPGGFAEVARRISDTFRQHYQVVDFCIPSRAMSAGTILAMSGDAIHMITIRF